MNSTLQNKLMHYEQTPSLHNWDLIEAALEDNTRFQGEKLFHFQQTPGDSVWNSIENKLDQKTSKGKLIPLFNKYRQPLKYVVALVILAFITTAITLMVNKNAVSDEITAVHENKSSRESTSTTTPEIINQDNTDLNTEVDQLNKGKVSRSETAKTKDVQTNSNRYVTVAALGGKKVRLSQKAYTVFNCAENTASVNYIRCKENIQSLQKKMSVSLLSPSGDFAGLMDMIKSLEENN